MKIQLYTLQPSKSLISTSTSISSQLAKLEEDIKKNATALEKLKAARKNLKKQLKAEEKASLKAAVKLKGE
jgi:seryl-tRNA synthetase